MQRFLAGMRNPGSCLQNKSFFFQRYISLNILVPCTVTGKEGVNKYTGKETTLPAQVSSAQ